MIKLFLLSAIFITVSGLVCSGQADAAVAPSRGRLESDREVNIRRVRNLLRDREVGVRLERMGMEVDDIEARLQDMDDRELDQLAERLDGIAVGRSGLGLAVGLLVIASLVLLIIYLAERV